MKQCNNCKYARDGEQGLLCKKRTVRMCIREDGVQKLVLVNDCEVININNNCNMFKNIKQKGL